MKTEIDFETLKQASALIKGYIDHQHDLCNEYDGFFHLLKWSKVIRDWEKAARRWNWILELMGHAKP